MIAVILQPSYIPWRGYFDQIRRADTFVFYDDVQYDKHGWRNRNQIKTPTGKIWLTIPVHSRGVTENETPINQVKIAWEKPWRDRHFRTIAYSYNKAPHFKEYFPLLEQLYARQDALLADYTIETTVLLARALGFAGTAFLRSSTLGVEGHKTDRLVAILKKIGATHYISGPSASGYIEPHKFAEAGIALEYIKYEYPEYPQLHPPYDPAVSILDLLFMTGGAAGKYFSREAG